MKVSIIGIDLAKNVFQVCGMNQAGKAVFNRRLTRAKFPAFMAQQPSTSVAMEATASAHYWGRVLRRMGHEVLLLPPQHVKAFCRVHKSDAHDAIAICEAARRPKLHPVPIKSIPQQDLQLLNRHRRRLIRQRTTAINQIRGFAREYGVFFPKGRAQVMAALPGALEDAENELSFVARTVLQDLQEEVRALDGKIRAIEARLLELVKPLETYQQLLTIPGFGKTIAAAFVAAGIDGKRFANGRACAAWLGLVPRQNSSGDRVAQYGITKNGDRELRTLLIHGARSVVSWGVKRKRDDALGRWVRQLDQRRGRNRTVVALANKMARIGWAVINHEDDFDMNKAFAG